MHVTEAQQVHDMIDDPGPSDFRYTVVTVLEP
jgi:hypothetical protein